MVYIVMQKLTRISEFHLEYQISIIATLCERVRYYYFFYSVQKKLTALIMFIWFYLYYWLIWIKFFKSSLWLYLSCNFIVTNVKMKRIIVFCSDGVDWVEIMKFIKSFNTVNTYLIVSLFLLVFIVVYFYFINPV